jgi:hypothetical protein
MDLCETKFRVLSHTFTLVSGIHNSRLVFELISHENVLAKIFGNVASLLNLNLEANFFTKQLFGLVDKQFVIKVVRVPILIARGEGATKNTTGSFTTIR